MSRDLASELDDLKSEFRALRETIDSLKARPGGIAQPEERVGGNLSREIARAKVPRCAELEDLAKEHGHVGLMACCGYYGPENTDNRWDILDSSENLLALDDDMAAKVLAALGSKPRLMLLKAILQQPGSAAELVERLGLGTTGQVYHHLKALQVADLIEQEERGIYRFRGHRVQALFILLLGVSRVLDTRHTAGNWEDGSL